MEKKTTQEKLVYIVLWALRIGILLFYAYQLYLFITTGEYIPIPLTICLILVLIGIPNIISIRRRYQGSVTEQKQFNRMLVRSILIAVAIMFFVIVGTVLYAVYMR